MHVGSTNHDLIGVCPADCVAVLAVVRSGGRVAATAARDTPDSRTMDGRDCQSGREGGRAVLGPEPAVTPDGCGSA